MSVHKSLKSKTTLSRTRNVYTREERLLKLTREGRLDEEDSLFGLPKVLVEKVKKRVKDKKVKTDETDDAAATDADATGDSPVEKK